MYSSKDTSSSLIEQCFLWLLNTGAQNPKWAGKRNFNRAGKNNFCNPTTPDNNQNEAAVVGFMGDRRRYTMEYRNARFMVVPVICLCCRGVWRRH